MKIGSKSNTEILREALQIAVDGLIEANRKYACIRPDTIYAGLDALRKTDWMLIPHASEIEKRIVGKLVHDLLAAGYVLSVNDGEEITVRSSTDPAVIFPALASTDADTLHVTLPGKFASFVYLVWGNDADVIADHGVSLEGVLAEANELAEALR